MNSSLAPYPMPPGVKRLMPFQEYPFNGDGYAAGEVLRLKAKHGLTKALETGTCLGSTTLWLSENFDKVWTSEVCEEFYDIASQRFTAHQKPHALDTTERFWQNIIARRRDSVMAVRGDADRAHFFFLDAHWGDTCPLLGELGSIANPERPLSRKPVIMIHDWQVPGRPDLGHDHFPDGRPFALEHIAGHLDAIYGVGGWGHHYNDKAEGAKRGILYVEPKV